MLIINNMIMAVYKHGDIESMTPDILNHISIVYINNI